MVELTVNGEQHSVDVAPETPLLYVLRNDLGLCGVRTGCSIGECGVCTVIADREAVRSCLTPVVEAEGQAITTPEGLGTPDSPHPIQQAFLSEQAAQCGYCVNGMIMTIAAALDAPASSKENGPKEAKDLRRRSSGEPGVQAVQQVAAERAGWVPHVGPSGRGLGLAFVRYKDSKAYAAQVAEVDVDVETGEITVHRMVVVADAGTIVNVDGLRNQLEGGTIQGLSRAMHEQVGLGDDGVTTRDWTTYPVLRFRHVPRIEVVMVDRPGSPPLGAGESATPPVPAALANAIDDAVGIRLRDLPLTPARLRQRLYDMDEAEAARVRL